MTKLRSGRRTATSGGGGAGAASKGAAKKKRTADEDNEEDFAKKFKKAKPSINKAAEELVCPILQDLPIDPVIAADVSALSNWLTQSILNIGASFHGIAL